MPSRGRNRRIPAPPIVEILVCGRRYCSIFFAAVIIVVLWMFAEDPLVVLDLVYLDYVPKREDGRPTEKRTLEIIRRVI